jgi:hypothetical protein
MDIFLFDFFIPTFGYNILRYFICLFNILIKCVVSCVCNTVTKCTLMCSLLFWNMGPHLTINFYFVVAELTNSKYSKDIHIFMLDLVLNSMKQYCSSFKNIVLI